jgi:hypothetical protein
MFENAAIATNAKIVPSLFNYSTKESLLPFFGSAGHLFVREFLDKR